MSQTFKPGDRALLIPLSVLHTRFWWAPLTITGELTRTLTYSIIDGDLRNESVHDFEFDDPSLRLLSKTCAAPHRFLKLPENGPDDEVLIARKLIAQHAGE